MGQSALPRARASPRPAWLPSSGSSAPEVAPSVSLYVNGYNVRAVRTYERVGFRRVGTFATVLF